MLLCSCDIDLKCIANIGLGVAENASNHQNDASNCKNQLTLRYCTCLLTLHDFVKWRGIWNCGEVMLNLWDVTKGYLSLIIF